MFIEKINLQLFSTFGGQSLGQNETNHINVTTDVRTTGQTYPSYNDLSAEMKTYYDMTLIDEAGPQLVHDQFAQKRPIPKNGGKNIEFRKFSNLPKALTALTEGVTPDGKRLDVTTITATVSQYGDYITQSDVLELTALDNTILEATKLLGRQAGLTLDTVTRNVLQSGTNVMFCPNIGAGGVETAVDERGDLDATSALTVKVIQQAVAKMRANNVPTINGDYVAIIHPYVAYDLMRDPEWKDVKTYDPKDWYEGELGKIANVRFVESSEAKIYAGSADECPTGLAVFGTLLLGQGAYGTTEITGGGLQTIVKQKGSAGTADPLDQRSSVGWKAMKTAEILVENYLLRIESCSPVYSAQITEAN